MKTHLTILLLAATMAACGPSAEDIAAATQAAAERQQAMEQEAADMAAEAAAQAAADRRYALAQAAVACDVPTTSGTTTITAGGPLLGQAGCVLAELGLDVPYEGLRPIDGRQVAQLDGFTVTYWAKANDYTSGAHLRVAIDVTD